MATAPGLNVLGPDLLGRVLELLPLKPLKDARLVARIFDTAAREHTTRMTTFVLSSWTVPKPGSDDVAVPRCWARLPRLRRLVVRDWTELDMPRLHQIMASGSEEALGRVREVEAEFCSAILAPATWEAILARMPRVASVRLGYFIDTGYRNDVEIAVLETIASVAGRTATRLNLSNSRLDAAAVAVIASNMPHLASLSFNLGSAEEAGADGQSELWAALPCTRLTEFVLCCSDQFLQPPPSEALPFARMRVLQGIVLPAEKVVALEQGLPRLEWLHALPEGEWADLELPARAAFASLTRLELAWDPSWPLWEWKRSSFHCSAQLPQLFPALERIESTVGLDAVIGCDIASLSRLTHLGISQLCLACTHSTSLQSIVLQKVGVDRRIWGRMHVLRNLRELKVQIAPVDAHWLARLPPSLTALDVTVWTTYKSFMAHGTNDASEVLEAVANGPRLRKLRMDAHWAAPMPQASWAQLVQGSLLTSLEDLELRRPEPRQLHDVSTLAMLPGLRRLHVWPYNYYSSGRGTWRTDPVKALVEEHAARGLEIVLRGSFPM